MKTAHAVKEIKKLQGLTDLMLSFNIEKYNVFKEMSEKLGWDNIYVNDVRYDLIRMTILDCYIKKGFFTISDLSGIIDKHLLITLRASSYLFLSIKFLINVLKVDL